MSNKQWESMGDSAKRWGIVHACAWCGSENVSKSEWSDWDVLSQTWKPSAEHERHWCNKCDGDVDVLIETVNIGEYEDDEKES